MVPVSHLAFANANMATRENIVKSVNGVENFNVYGEYFSHLSELMSFSFPSLMSIYRFASGRYFNGAERLRAGGDA